MGTTCSKVTPYSAQSEQTVRCSHPTVPPLVRCSPHGRQATAPSSEHAINTRGHVCLRRSSDFSVSTATNVVQPRLMSLATSEDVTSLSAGDSTHSIAWSQSSTASGLDDLPGQPQGDAFGEDSVVPRCQQCAVDVPALATQLPRMLVFDPIMHRDEVDRRDPKAACIRGGGRAPRVSLRIAWRGQPCVFRFAGCSCRGVVRLGTESFFRVQPFCAASPIRARGATICTNAETCLHI